MCIARLNNCQIYWDDFVTLMHPVHGSWSQGQCDFCYLGTYACMHAQSCLTLWDPMDCRLPDSSVHGVSQARILEWVAIFSSRGSSWPRDGAFNSCGSCICRQILYYWATWEAHMCTLYFLYSFASDRRLACFCILAFMNNPAVDLGVQLSLQYTNFLSLDIFPEVGWLDHTVHIFKNFEDPLYSFP